MKRALTLAAGMAIGYVAGARAGRERYDQIRQKAHEIGQQPSVVDARENLRESATAATKTVAGKVTDAASGLAHKLHSSDEEDDGVVTTGVGSGVSGVGGTKTTPSTAPRPTPPVTRPDLP